jgi:hypothetical protein
VINCAGITHSKQVPQVFPPCEIAPAFSSTLIMVP